MITQKTEKELRANPLRMTYRLDEGLIRANFKNVVLVINTKDGSITTEDHNPKWQFTRCIPCNYNPYAKCPLFWRVLRQAVPDKKDRRMLLMILANCFLPWQRWEVMLILFGPTNTGKSTVLNAVTAAIGKDNCSAVNLEALGDWDKTKGRPLEMLEKSMLNVSLENKTTLVSTNMMKAILSGEDIYCDPKFKKAQNKRTAATFVMATNSPVRMPGASDAEMKRMRILAMEQRIPNGQIDASIKKRLLDGEENEGITALLLRYLPEVFAAQIAPFGGARSEQLYREFCMKIDPVSYFISKYYDCQGSVKKSLLEEHYKEFMFANGSTQMTWASDADKLWKQIKINYGIDEEFKKTCSDGSRQLYLRGIRRKVSTS